MSAPWPGLVLLLSALGAEQVTSVDAFRAAAVVVAALNDQNPQVRLDAVQALNLFGRPAASYIPTLERVSKLNPSGR
jgi:hypothetical protein